VEARRINNLQLGGAAKGPPPEFRLAEFANRSFGAFQEKPEDIVIRFAKVAAPDARRLLFHPTQTMEDQPDGSLGSELNNFAAKARQS
jgi:hypothetical protein